MAVLSTTGAPIAPGLPEQLNRTPTMNEFQWLLVLGFPAEIAAAAVMPNVFLVGDNTDNETASPTACC